MFPTGRQTPDEHRCAWPTSSLRNACGSFHGSLPTFSEATRPLPTTRTAEGPEPRRLGRVCKNCLARGFRHFFPRKEGMRGRAEKWTALARTFRAGLPQSLRADPDDVAAIASRDVQASPIDARCRPDDGPSGKWGVHSFAGALTVCATVDLVALVKPPEIQNPAPPRPARGVERPIRPDLPSPACPGSSRGRSKS